MIPNRTGQVWHIDKIGLILVLNTPILHNNNIPGLYQHLTTFICYYNEYMELVNFQIPLLESEISPLEKMCNYKRIL